MREQISAGFTRAVRWGLPAIFVGAFGAGILASWTIMDPPNPPPLADKILGTAWWAVVSAGIVWFTRRLRDVWVDDDRLVVSARGGEWTAPLSAVEDVSENPVFGTVTVRIRTPDGGVQPVTFIPPPTLFRLPFKPHPTAQYLRERATECRQVAGPVQP
jgi:hypothetical protein